MLLQIRAAVCCALHKFMSVELVRKNETGLKRYQRLTPVVEKIEKDCAVLQLQQDDIRLKICYFYFCEYIVICRNFILSFTYTRDQCTFTESYSWGIMEDQRTSFQ
jgi:hypothetical protein